MMYYYGFNLMVNLLTVIAVGHTQLILTGYSDGDPVVLNQNGVTKERQVLVACKGFFGRFGSIGFPEAEVPWPLEERNCLLKCQYKAHRIFFEDWFAGHPHQHFSVQELAYYLRTFTNATAPIAYNFVTKFTRCASEAEVRKRQLWVRDSLPDECHYYRLFYKCLNTSG